jgi:RHS repeat-associated protein
MIPMSFQERKRIKIMRNATHKCLADYLFSRFSGVVLFVSLLILFSNQLAYSQVPMNARDNKSTISISDYEKINLYDGNFNFNLPLVSLGGRGVSNGISLNLEQRWRSDDIIVGYSGSTPNIMQRISSDPYALTGLFPQAGGYLTVNTRVVNTAEVGQCSNETVYRAAEKEISVNFSGFGGQGYQFVSQVNDGDTVLFSNPQCFVSATSSLGTVFYATDGSGTKFISNQPVIIDDELGSPQIYASGVVKFPNGTSYGIDAGLVSWTEDRNGNKTYITNTGYQDDPRENRVTAIKDSLNREIQTSGNQNFQYITYKGFGGASRTVKVSFCSSADPCLRAGETQQMLSTLFPWIAPSHPSNTLVGGGIIKDIELPDARKYKFFYNSYGELARVEFPTGGATEYDYEAACGGYCLQRRIKERRVYSNGVNLDSKIQYSYSSALSPLPGTSLPSSLWTIEKTFDNQNSLKSMVKHYFVGCIPDSGTNCYVPTGYEPPNTSVYLTGRETRTDVYDSDGTTLLRKTEAEYELNGRLIWRTGNGPYKFFRPKKVTTTLADSNQVGKVEYSYDSSVPYNLQTDVYEYDYGFGAPGSFLRRSHTDFEKGSNYTSNSVNLINLPLETWVSSDASGNTKVFRTQYEYDNYVSDSNHAPLVNRSNITGHDSTNYGTSYTTRGNVTKITSYANVQNQTGAVSSYRQYDIAGNPVKDIDGKGYANIFDYSDRFGSPNGDARGSWDTVAAPSQMAGLNTFAFATNSINASGYTTYSQFDYYSGDSIDTEDINGNVSTTFYNDILGRPTQTIRANNRAAYRVQATAIYNDDINQRKITITADSKTFGDNLVKSEAFYDGLGRTIETRDYETNSNYIVTLQEYDSLGRAYKSSNPYRPYLSEPPQWATTSFDSMGRVTEVKTADNAKVTRSYWGAAVSVQDQAGRHRSGVTDALGRLTKVVEYDNGADLETFYTYDVLGRLRKTVQGAQSRYFMYDDLGRLIRAKQTEQTANSSLAITDSVTGNSNWSVAYSYDNNGNVTSSTDSRGITIAGSYDNLNRLTFRDYSDATSDVTFTFDNPNIANSKGQLTAVSSNLSTTDYTAFDILGRIKSSSQTIDGQTYNFSDYSYDLSGALVSETYPSGRIVRTESDQIGRLSKVTSQLSSQVEKIYLSNLSYTAFGAVSQAKLGNGRWESTQYDNKRFQITQIGVGGSAGDTSLLKLEYNYGTTTPTTSDNNGSLRQQKITVPGMSNQITQNYTYDYLNRLQSATETAAGNSTPTWKQSFTYDRYGNRRFDAANTTTLPANNAVYNPQIDANTNKFLVSEGYNYDAEGNLTSNPESQLFQYNAENKQVQVQNTSNGSSANYYYDGNGKRVKKVVGNQETIFVYNAFGKLVAEYTTNQAITAEGTKYLTTDALESVRVITNAIGKVISRHDYMPFGEEAASGTGGRTQAQGYLTNSSGIRQDGVSRQFTGYERDIESGLDFAQNRYFAGKHGRFTSVDPLTSSADTKNPQTLNRYTYALNSPYEFTDPLGLSPCGNSNPNGFNAGRECTQADDGSAAPPGTSSSPPAGDHAKKSPNRGVSKIVDMLLNDEDVDGWLNLPSTISINWRRFPNFDTLWKNHAGGNSLPLEFEHQCAAKLSLALQLSGVDMTTFFNNKKYKDGFRSVTVNGKTYKIGIRAYDLWDWIYNNFANGNNDGPGEYLKTEYDKVEGAVDVADKFKHKQGIIIFFDFWGNSQGHIDLWDGENLGGGVVYGPNSFFDRARKIILLDVDISASVTRRK